MPTVEARVETERPSRYLGQLCKHFSNKGRHLGRRLHGHSGSGDGQALREMRAVAEQAQIEWSDTEGQVALPWGADHPAGYLGSVGAACRGGRRRRLEAVAGPCRRASRGSVDATDYGWTGNPPVLPPPSAKAPSAGPRCQAGPGCDPAGTSRSGSRGSRRGRPGPARDRAMTRKQQTYPGKVPVVPAATRNGEGDGAQPFSSVTRCSPSEVRSS
nr:DUF2218 domain-containing protein [Streptomyces davaonensis]